VNIKFQSIKRISKEEKAKTFCEVLKGYCEPLANCKAQNLRLIREHKKVMKSKIKLVFDDIEEVFQKPTQTYPIPHHRIYVDDFYKIKKKHLGG